MADKFIERLENPSWSDCTCDLVMAEAAQAIAAMAAERDALREALEAIANESPEYDSYGAAWFSFNTANDVLKGGPANG